MSNLNTAKRHKLPVPPKKSEDIFAFIKEFPDASDDYIAKFFGIARRTVVIYRSGVNKGFTCANDLAKYYQDKSNPKRRYVRRNGNDNVLELTPQMEVKEEPEYAVTDHALAVAEMFDTISKKLRTGTHPEELGPQVTLLGRMMSRRT